MISDTLLKKFISKYANDDVNFVTTREQYEKCVSDPECYSRMREEDNKRNRAYHERQRANPSESFVNRQRGKVEALKAMKQSGSLDGLARILSEKLATYKSEIVKKLRKRGLEPEAIMKEPAVIEFLADAQEIYYLRDKVKEFAETLMFIEPGKPLRPEQTPDLLNLKTLCDSYLSKFSRKYPPIIKAIEMIIEKLRTIAGGMILWNN